MSAQRARWLIAGLTSMLALGCANLPTKVKSIDDATWVIDYGASRRGAYVRKGPAVPGQPGLSLVTICAEPAPDVAIALTTDLSAKLDTASSTDVEAKARISEQIIDLARRGQSLQMQREALYRLCEFASNTRADATTVAKLYQDVLKTIQAIALSELAHSLPGSDQEKSKLLNKIIEGDSLAPPRP